MKGAGDILERILAVRKTDLEQVRREMPEAELRRRAARRRHHSLIAVLRRDEPRPQIIAETKKASPSAGLLCPAYRPEAIARAYADAGAAAISVLTEPRFFLGRIQDLGEVRSAVPLPILRKDFITDPYQVLEAAAWGADVVLLIVAALAPAQLRKLYRYACALGLEVLVEAHTEEELALALSLKQAILGVNSRNLKTLRTDLNVAKKLARIIPSGRIAVAESGIRTAAEIAILQKLGYRGFLIGEHLLRTGRPGPALQQMMANGGA